MAKRSLLSRCPSYLQDYTGMHGQQNIKKLNSSIHVPPEKKSCCSLRILRWLGPGDRRDILEKIKSSTASAIYASLYTNNLRYQATKLFH